MSAWNKCTLVIGLPGDGKTTLQRLLIKQHLETTNGIVLAHDPLRQFVRLGFAYYASVDDWKAAAAKSAREKVPMKRGASIGGLDSDGIVRAALDLGERVGNNDTRTVLPILVPFDEGSLREGSGSTFIGKLDNEFLVTRRHRGVGPVFNLQEVTQLTARFYQVSTDVYAFAQTEDRCELLDKHMHLPRGTLARAGLSRLGPHKYMRIRMRVGPVSEAL